MLLGTKPDHTKLCVKFEYVLKNCEQIKILCS